MLVSATEEGAGAIWRHPDPWAGVGSSSHPGFSCGLGRVSSSSQTVVKSLWLSPLGSQSHLSSPHPRQYNMLLATLDRWVQGLQPLPSLLSASGSGWGHRQAQVQRKRKKWPLPLTSSLGLDPCRLEMSFKAAPYERRSAHHTKHRIFACKNKMYSHTHHNKPNRNNIGVSRMWFCREPEST